jgi:hypothetical protein
MTVVIQKADLAALLGIAVERLHLEVLQSDGMVSFQTLVDGKDLSPEQERIATRFFASLPGIAFVMAAGKS